MAATMMLAVSNSSRKEVLKGFIAQKLNSTAQEIFTVIERTVAAYEEEAAGLRQEIDRQETQLGVLLQLKLEATDADDRIPVCKPAAGQGGGGNGGEGEGANGGGGRGEATIEKEQNADELGVEDRGNTGLKMEEDEDDEEDGVENLIEPVEEEEEEEEPERLMTPSASPDRIMESPFQTHEPEDHISLRIRILEGPDTDLTNPVVFRTYPLQELKCPPGLLEADFFSLLRSSFPQLAVWTHFDFFIEKERELRLLEVQPLTPEELYEGTGPRTIYIRPTNMLPEDLAEEETFVSSRLSDETIYSPYKTRSQQPRVRSERRKEKKTDVCIKIRILDHLPSDRMISPEMLQKCPTVLHCPPDMQEADFLKLLRSSCPQLADQQTFNLFRASKKRELQPIGVGMLTPAEISKCAVSSIIYIQPKTGELTPRQDKAAAPDSPASDAPRPSLSIRLASKSLKTRFKEWQSDTENHVYLRISVLDPHVHVITSQACKRYPNHLVKCPRGLQENEFLDLLSSAFPQLGAHTSIEFFMDNRRNRRLQVEARTPEEIQEFMSSAGFTSVLYIRPKEQESVQSSHEDAEDISSTPDQTGQDSMDLDSMDLDEPDNEDSEGSESAVASLDFHENESYFGVPIEGQDQDEQEPGETEPDETNTEQPVNSTGVQTTPFTLKTVKRKAPLLCQICQTVRRSMNMLIKHSYSHIRSPGRLCGVCGHHSRSAAELRSHLQTHRKRHSCYLCGKTFLSSNGLKGHINRHIHPELQKRRMKVFSKSEATRRTQKHLVMAKKEKKKQYMCNYCNQSMDSLLSLSEHLTSHLNQVPKGIV